LDAVWNGKRVGNAVWASIRGGTSAHAGRVHAALVGDSERHGHSPDPALHLRRPAAEGDRSDGGDFGVGRGVCDMDDSAVVRLRHELPHAEISAVAEQDHGDGVDRRGGAGAAHRVQLASHAAPRVGPGGRRRGSERLMVVHRRRSVCVYTEWDLWGSVVRLLP